MKMYGGTDIGLVRETNQDNFYIDEAKNWAVVADGMGGHNGGETASNLAVEEIKKSMAEEAELTEAVEAANSVVYNMSVENRYLDGMGTTVVLCRVEGGKAHFAHVGDSRAYILRGGELKQITKDHSIVQQLIDCGTITEEQAKYHPQRNLITRAVGTEKGILVDYNTAELLEGDIVVMCSDGLSSYVSEQVIAETVKGSEGDAAVKRLIELANESGGKDNVTVVIIKA